MFTLRYRQRVTLPPVICKPCTLTPPHPAPLCKLLSPQRWLQGDQTASAGIKNKFQWLLALDHTRDFHCQMCIAGLLLNFPAFPFICIFTSVLPASVTCTKHNQSKSLAIPAPVLYTKNDITFCFHQNFGITFRVPFTFPNWNAFFSFFHFIFPNNNTKHSGFIFTFPPGKVAIQTLATFFQHLTSLLTSNNSLKLKKK